MYMQLKPIYDKLTTEEKVSECMHSYNSQCNEALNTSVGKYARKGRTYCGTMSLTNRITIAIGVHNVGYQGYWTEVCTSLSMEISPNLDNHLLQRDRRKNWKRKYESTPEVKKRGQGFNTKKCKNKSKNKFEIMNEERLTEVD